MYVYVYRYIYIYIYIYVCVHIYIMVQSSGFGFRNALSCLVCLSLFAGGCADEWLGGAGCMLICKCTHVCRYAFMCVCMYVYTYSGIYIHACIQK